MNDRIQDLISSPGLKYFLFVAVPLLLAGAFALSKPTQIFTIARNTFVESVRQPIYFVLIMLSGVLQLFNTWGSAYSMGYTDTAEVSGDNKVLLDIGLATIFVCGTLLAAFIATAVISREIERKTVLTVVSKPISRTAVVLGKYLGVSAAMMIAIVTMVMFLLMGLRHGVMSTAADDLDQPVLLFTFLALALSLGIAVWCNFFYGWVFSQTATMLLCPFMIGAYILVLVVNKKWQLQGLAVDFKPQITLACSSLLMAELVLTAIATAASARLGQVMTIVICAGVFVFGLLSNHFVGRQAFSNKLVGRIQAVSAPDQQQELLLRSGDTNTVQLEFDPTSAIKPGTPFYYGPNPNGYPLSNRAFVPGQADYTKQENVSSLKLPPALVVTEVKGRNLTVRHVGQDGVVTRFLPKPEDYVFVKPTTVNLAAWGAWGVIPNVQLFWLVDAVTQNQPIPASHVALIAVYAVAQIGVFLSLAVMLFQTREVG